MAVEDKFKKNDFDNTELQEEYEIPEKRDYEAEIIDIIRSKVPVAVVKDRLNDYHENDIAAVLERMDVAGRRKLYSIIGLERASEVFAYIDEPKDYIEELDLKTAAAILEQMDADEAVDILDELDSEKTAELIHLMNSEAKKDIGLIQSYDEDEIGSKMTINFVTLTLDLTIKAAMRSMVIQAADNDNISTLYVLKKDGTFYGAIDLKDLIIARNYVDLESLVTTSYPYVYDHESVDDCIEALKDYSEDSIPVVDKDMHILGVITSQDLVEVVDEEMGEDYAKLAGLTSEEDLEEPLLESMKKRIPWLITLLVLGLVVSSVVGIFETVVATLPLIICFQSLILDMAGNVGTQSLAVTIRVLMDEELTFKQQAGFIMKEMKVGFVNGFLLGAISFIATGVYIWIGKGQLVSHAFAMSGCIGISLWLAMIISSFVGTIIPIFFNKIKVDPAVASGPLITTVNDLVAVVTYYGLTWILLINVVHMG